MPNFAATATSGGTQKRIATKVESKSEYSTEQHANQRPARRLSIPNQPLRVGDEVRVVNAARPIMWHTVRGFRNDEVILDSGSLDGIRSSTMIENRRGCAVAIVLERDPAAGNPSDVFAQNLSSPELTEQLRNISSASKAYAADDMHEDYSRESFCSYSTDSDDDSDSDSDSDSDGMFIEELEEASAEQDVMAPEVKMEHGRDERNAMIERVRL